MGCTCGKGRKMQQPPDPAVGASPGEQGGGEGESGDGPYRTGPGINWEEIEKDTQRANLSNLREDLQTNPEQLLLNLILMSVQFLKHFDKDREALATEIVEQKTSIDQALVDKRKHVIYPPSLFSKIQEYVSYKEEQSETLEPLIATDCLFCYSNIETYRTEDFGRMHDSSEQYTQLDNPIYRVVIEEAKNLGYVKVRCADDPVSMGKQKSENDHPSDISENEEEEEDDEFGDEFQSAPNIQAPLLNNMEKYNVPMAKMSLQPPPGPASIMKRRNSFDPIAEYDVEEEVDGPDMDFMSALKNRVDPDNYIKPMFGPSEREQAKDPKKLSMLNERQLGERRPSGVMPQGYLLQQEIYQTRRNKKEEKEESTASNGPSSIISTKHKVIAQSEEEEYAYVTHRPIPLSQFDERKSKGSIISDSCFLTKEVPIVEDSDTDPYPIQADTEKRCYISSKRLMFFFANQFYEVARSIGKGSVTSSAKILPPKILCREEVEDSYMERKWHFIPTFEVGFWPDNSFEFFFRKRTVMRDRRTNVSYQWPTNAQVQAARQLGCNIVPVGFTHPKKTDENADSEIEWEVLFTKAEMFLSKNMNLPKIHAFTFFVLLFKTYFEEFDGLKEKHIRHMFYWLVERSPGDWTEENLGEKFLLMLRSMKSHLTKQKMPHFFISKSNMFANIPNHKLRQAQEKVHRIRERPVFHLLHSLLKLQFEKNFYPRLDVVGLFNLLTTSDTLATLNPALLGATPTEGGLWDKKKMEQDRGQQRSTGDRYQDRMRQIRSNMEEKARKSKSDTKGSEPVVDLQADMKPFDEARKTLVLEFFIGHFIKMAERSNNFRNHGQSLMYLLQAENLVTILIEDFNLDGSENVRQFQHDIMKLREGVNYSLYRRDCWAISFGPKSETKGGSLRGRSEQDLPPRPARSPLTPRSEGQPEVMGAGGEKSGKSASRRLEVPAEIHEPAQKEERTGNGTVLHIRNFDVSESSDFDYSEFTHL